MRYYTTSVGGHLIRPGVVSGYKIPPLPPPKTPFARTRPTKPFIWLAGKEAVVSQSVLMLGILLILVALHGTLLAAILWFHPRHRPGWLATVVTVVSILVWFNAFAVFGLTARFPHLIGLTFPLWYVIGPALYLHVRRGSDLPARPLSLLAHFGIGIVISVYLIPFWVLPGDLKLALARNGPIIGGSTAGMLSLSIVFLLQVSVYAALTRRLADRASESTRQMSADARIERVIWIHRTIFVMGAYLAADLTVAVGFFLTGGAPPVWIQQSSVIALSVTLYAVGYAILLQPTMLFLPSVDNGAAKYRRSNIDEETRARYLEGLRHLMAEEKAYRQTDLKLSNVAEQLGISRHHLSQVLNQDLGVSFYDFVNGYRVDEAAARLLDPASANQTVLAVAHDVGFNSSAAFYRVFKRCKKTTPTEFVAQYRNRNTDDPSAESMFHTE